MTEEKENRRAIGKKIVVVDNGFVYAGECLLEKDDFLGVTLYIINAQNIRVWGTDKGLGQLTKGWRSGTVRDAAGTVAVPYSRVCHLLECAG